MGGIWSSNLEFAAEFSEFVGYKAGLALSQDELHEHLNDCPEYDGFLKIKKYRMMRLRSETVESITGWLLWRVGRLDRPPSVGVGIDLYHKCKDSPELLSVFQGVFSGLPAFLEDSSIRAVASGSRLIDPKPFISAAKRRFGPEGGIIACELLLAFNRNLEANPWSRVRHVEWEDVAELRELFRSERLGSKYGKFIDQRFIDYLGANFDAVDKMNWRKFEGLVGEYFDRQGYTVELGPGRGDDGVDVRLWKKKAEGDPPLVLVQCKRQRSKIEKIVVKGLWADVKHERARSGLIVTTSVLSPGAAAVAKARAYPVSAADRSHLRTWIKKLRTPGTGVFLGE
jgi:restriction system protein